MIKVNNKHFIKHDGNQWILYELAHSKGDDKVSDGEVVGKHPEDKYTVLGYYYSLPQIATKIIATLGTANTSSIEELIKVYANLQTTLTKFLETKADVNSNN